MTDDLAKRLRRKIAILATFPEDGLGPELAFYTDTRNLLLELEAEIIRLEDVWNNRPYQHGPFTGEIR